LGSGVAGDGGADLKQKKARTDHQSGGLRFYQTSEFIYIFTNLQIPLYRRGLAAANYSSPSKPAPTFGRK
jgi:hypothetical protein